MAEVDDDLYFQTADGVAYALFVDKNPFAQSFLSKERIKKCEAVAKEFYDARIKQNG